MGDDGVFFEDRSSSTAPVLYEVSERIATITLNRPDRLNAWTPQMQEQYLARLEEADGDPDVRVIVVTGAGDAFCAGADLEVVRADADDGGHNLLRRDGALTHTTATKVAKPVIASINGACAGIGFVHALMCDLRFAARGAQFSTAFARRGIIAEHGSSWLLPRMIGVHRAFDLLASARRFDAEEAHALGLLNGLVDRADLDSHVRAYARDFADNVAPTAMAAIKHQLYRHLHVDFESALHESFAMLTRVPHRRDMREGVDSFLEKRPPEFDPVQEFRSI